MEQYTVTGMSCAACSARVEKAVANVPGVTACSVSLLTNSMGVEGSADPAAVIAAVETAGYGAATKNGKQQDGKKKSVAFLFPEVTSQIEGDGEAITPETFRKLLSEIKEKEMAGALQVMTYYQYYQYRVQCQAEAEALKLEYEIFCQQKDARIKELDEEIRNVLEEYR